MDMGRLALVSIGAVAFALGLAVLTRRHPGEPARYRRRIVGTMLLAFGFAAVLFTLLLTHAQSQDLTP